MREGEINKKNLKKFIKNISKADYLELKHYFKKDIKKRFINSLTDKIEETYLLFDDNNKPVALGGAYKVSYPYKNAAQLWLLTSKNQAKHKISLFKYVKGKVEKYKNTFDFSYNYIFKSNFKALKWLKKLGFTIEKIENDDFRFFYYKKGIDNDTRNFTD